MRKTLFCIFAFMLLANAGKADDVTLTIEDYNNWGWESLVIRNGSIELVIVPEIGGRIMRYAMPDDQQMAISQKQIGKKYNPVTNSSGPWQGDIGYGGYKNWPSPQSYWNWPPPPVLDWGEYSYTVEHESADSVVVFLESSEEITRMPGLQQARRITAYKNSTLIKIEQYLTNINATVRDLGIWDITQTISKHEGKNDRGSFSVYFPAEKSKIRNPDNFEINEVADNIYQFRDTKGSGKMFMNNWAGWCVNVDENDNQSYFKLFDVYPDASYPDDNANFEIYSPGNGTYIEIEVMSPLQKLAKGETMRFDEYWSAANIAGMSINANKAGSIASSFISSDKNTFEGTFGIFNTGTVQLKFKDKDGNELGTPMSTEVIAGEKLEIVSERIPANTEQIELYAYNTENKLIDILTTAPTLKTGVNTAEIQKLKVYPTVAKSSETISIYSSSDINRIESLSIVKLNGQAILLDQTEQINSKTLTATLPNLSPGVYLLRLKSDVLQTNQKIIIK